MKKQQKPNADEVELRQDGWERFEKAVDVAVRTTVKQRAGVAAKSRRRPVPNPVER